MEAAVQKGAAPMMNVMPPSSPATGSLKPRHPLMSKQCNLGKEKQGKDPSFVPFFLSNFELLLS